MPRRSGKELLAEAERNLPPRGTAEDDDAYTERVRRLLARRYSNRELVLMIGAHLARPVRRRLG